MARRSGGSGRRRTTRAELTEYQRKRDFDRTTEPSGESEVTAGTGLRYVIQKHAASHLHFDLRLELDGVMKSWAVPKGPSLDPAVKRLAMQVEDHPISYNAFEGTIPRGEYGGGTVMLWDRGTYTPDEARADEEAEAAVRRGLRAGKLSFSLLGQRLGGSYALVRTERGAKPKWLLMKHRDDWAAPGSDITAEVLTSVGTGRTMDEIAAQRDRVWRSNRGGQSVAGRSRTSGTGGDGGDAVISRMQPTPARAAPAGVGWTFEAWHGGTGVIAWVTPESARIVDDRGTDRTRSCATIVRDLVALAGRTKRSFVLDGEIADQDGVPMLLVGDMLLDGDEALLHRPWQERRGALDALFHRRRVPHARRQQTYSDHVAVQRAAQRHGWPGVIARRVDAAYLPGEKSEGLLRIPVR
jgi:bifunctional non-homologous end joining protein LigD